MLCSYPVPAHRQSPPPLERYSRYFKPTTSNCFSYVLHSSLAGNPTFSVKNLTTVQKSDNQIAREVPTLSLHMSTNHIYCNGQFF